MHSKEDEFGFNHTSCKKEWGGIINIIVKIPSELKSRTSGKINLTFVWCPFIFISYISSNGWILKLYL